MAINKIDSNVTGLSYAEETTPKVLPGTPLWYQLEPNSYSDFGGQLKLIARNPINAGRQRKKGVVADLDASGGFSQDLTFDNTTRLLQGFFFADMREKKTTWSINTNTPTAITSVTAGTKTFAAASNLGGFISGNLVKTSGFSNTANNGVLSVNGASTATTLVVNEVVVTETPPASAKIEVVGFQFPSADVSIALNGNLVRLTSVATNMTTLGLIAGEWVYMGADLVANTFANNKGWARISVISANYLEFDKTDWTGVVEAGTGKTIRLYFGNIIKNEVGALIKRRTYNVERTLGQDANGTMSEYLVGAVPNQFAMKIGQAEKLTADLSFVATDNEQRTGLTGVKGGTRVPLVPGSAYNTSSDFARIKLSLVTPTDSAPAPLFAFASELNLTLNNGVQANKAVGVLGAFDTSAGTFEVGGSLTAYFADITAVQAVRNNADITLDIIMTKLNSGILFDMPLVALGNGRLNVQQDQSITLPLETTAAESKFGHTLLFQSFSYLPDVAN